MFVVIYLLYMYTKLLRLCVYGACLCMRAVWTLYGLGLLGVIALV